MGPSILLPLLSFVRGYPVTGGDGGIVDENLGARFVRSLVWWYPFAFAVRFWNFHNGFLDGSKNSI